MKISVIVPVRDDPDGVRELLARLRDQTLPQERFEVVIGDDGSKSGSLSGIATADSRVRVVTGPPKTSYAARNRAAHAANGAILAFCDADCRPDPRWLEEGLKALAHSDLVAGEVIFAPPPRPTGWSLLTIDMFLDQERNVRFSAAVTANLFVRRSVFESVGGFDESLPSGGDYDFTRRAVSCGARLVYAPLAIVRHPTLDRWRSFLRKVWFTNRWKAVRNARSGVRPHLAAVLEFVPMLGIALARRRVLRPMAALCRPRLVAAGLTPGWRDDLRAMPLLYFVVAYVIGMALIRGWWQGRRPSAPRVALSAFAPPARAGDNTVSHSPERRHISSPRKEGLPNLVIIGAQKCGTSSLHSYLDLHPAISMSRQKELNFFINERNWHRGVDWYRRCFDATAVVSGESSPNYSAFPRFAGVPERMASLIPEARLIFLVRDPLERIASAWTHEYAQRRAEGDLRTTLLDPKSAFIWRSCYHLQLQRFLEYFDKSQILVLDSRDLLHRRLHTLRRVFEFVGVDPNFYHPWFERLHHTSDLKRRATPLGLHLRRLSRTWARRGSRTLLWRGFEATFGLSHRIDARPNVWDALDAAAIQQLREDAEKFRSQTGLVLDHWSIFSAGSPAQSYTDGVA